MGAEVANGNQHCEEVVSSALCIFRQKYNALREGMFKLAHELRVTKEQGHLWESNSSRANLDSSGAVDTAEEVVTPTPAKTSISAGRLRQPLEEAGPANIMPATSGAHVACSTSNATMDMGRAHQERVANTDGAKALSTRCIDEASEDEL